MNANQQPSEVAMRVAKALQREFGGTFEWTNTLLHMVAGIVDRELELGVKSCQRSGYGMSGNEPHPMLGSTSQAHNALLIAPEPKLKNQ